MNKTILRQKIESGQKEMKTEEIIMDTLNIPITQFIMGLQKLTPDIPEEEYQNTVSEIEEKCKNKKCMALAIKQIHLRLIEDEGEVLLELTGDEDEKELQKQGAIRSKNGQVYMDMSSDYTRILYKSMIRPFALLEQQRGINRNNLL